MLVEESTQLASSHAEALCEVLEAFFSVEFAVGMAAFFARGGVEERAD